jgi:hypothetical protein
MRTNAVLIDLDGRARGERQSPFIVAVLALAIGGIGGYAIGLSAAGSTIPAATSSTFQASPPDLTIGKRIATCDSRSGFASQPDYCLGLGDWKDW